MVITARGQMVITTRVLHAARGQIGIRGQMVITSALQERSAQHAGYSIGLGADRLRARRELALIGGETARHWGHVRPPGAFSTARWLLPLTDCDCVFMTTRYCRSPAHGEHRRYPDM